MGNPVASAKPSWILCSRQLAKHDTLVEALVTYPKSDEPCAWKPRWKILYCVQYETMVRNYDHSRGSKEEPTERENVHHARARGPNAGNNFCSLFHKTKVRIITGGDAMSICNFHDDGSREPRW